MTHTVNTTIVKESRYEKRFYSVEVVDYDNDTYDYQMEAYNYHNACEKARMMAIADGVDVNYMNVYTY